MKLSMGADACCAEGGHALVYILGMSTLNAIVGQYFLWVVFATKFRKAQDFIFHYKEGFFKQL